MENNELVREKEFTSEEQHLESVKKQINKEIISHIAKRKDMSDYILEYRKNVLEEYRDDEDKIIDYFDHERFVKEEAFKSIDRKFKELTILLNTPYFGRVDFEEEGLDEETIYIGRFGLTPQGSYEPLIVDWRAPVSALFYTSSLGNTAYQAPIGDIHVDIQKKRQFIIKKGHLTGMFDSALDIKDEILQLVLSQNAGQKLKDVIMTIQEEQDRIIRRPRESTVVVDGVAGSGKTTIALHRVAYLLYNYRNILQDKVLILGPNSIFMEYISTVLPSLGEVGVKQRTFREFAVELLELDEELMSFKQYMERILKNDEHFITEILRKNSEQYIEEMETLIQGMEGAYFHAAPVVFFDKIIVPLEEIQKMFEDYYKDMPLFRRSKKIRRVLFSKIKDGRDERVRAIEKEYKEAVSKLTEDELNLQYNSLQFSRKIKIREVIQEVLRVKKALRWLASTGCTEIYKTFNGEKELTIDDLAPILYLKVKLEGFRVKGEIKHVVIDEAQDYSKLQFLVIQALTQCTSLTIVGDSNQRIIPITGQVPMLSLENTYKGLAIENYKLEKSYRSTEEIMNYANRYLKENTIVPLVRKGVEVTEEVVTSEELLKQRLREGIHDFRQDGHESIAVVCRNEVEVQRIAELLHENEYVKVLNTEEMVYTGGVVILPVYFAKGLEFDAVLMVSSASNLAEDKLKYVMSTRALHELRVYLYGTF